LQPLRSHHIDGALAPMPSDHHGGQDDSRLTAEFSFVVGGPVYQMNVPSAANWHCRLI
jgi:hypothetical protein